MELQNQCLVYIIAHLDEFTPSSLALLSTRLRCLLLVNLPAVDICQLERTEVVHGIDMCRNVWRNVGFQRLPVRVRVKLVCLTAPLPTEGSPLGLDYKGFFFSCISSVVLSSLGSPKYLPWYDSPCPCNTQHLRYAEASIFAVPLNILGVQKWKKLQDSFTVQPEYKFLAPPRYSWIADPKLRCHKESQLIDILIEKCGILPTQVWINCESFMRHIWQSKHLKPLLYQFLSNILVLRTTVTLQRGPLTSGFLNVPSFLLKAILQHKKKGLRHLAIDGEEHYVLAVLHSMMTLLGPFIHQHTSKSIPYSGLERLEVSLESTEGGDMERCYSEASSYLASILQHQRAINSLSLQSWPLTSPKLVSAFSSLFHQPHYTSVSLKCMIIPFPLFQELVGSFLSSPNRKQLRLNNISFEEQCHMNQPTRCKIPAHSLLTLDICDIESLAVVPMLSCVIGYPSLHLNTLFLTNLGTLKDEGVLDFLCHAPDIQIKHLSLCNITCSLQKCQNQWDSIFCDWNLSALEFCRRDIGQQGLHNPETAQTAVTSNAALIHSL